MIRLKIVISTLVAAALLGGCGPRERAIQIVPEPDQSEVYLDGELLGVGVAEYKLAAHDGNDHELRVCGPEGYFCAQGVLNQDSRDVIKVAPPRDEGFFATVESPVVEEWQTLGVRDAESLEGTWKELVALVEKTESDIDVLDPRSYYLRTAWKMAGNENAESRIRSRLTIGLGGSKIEDVELRLKIETERVDEKGRIVGKPRRTFPEFIEVLDAARSL